jgi:CMP-N,N'-diacetyllegionaminic acid synthase
MAQKKSVLGIIPARGGSKRVHRKNVRELHGKTLVDWCVNSAMEATEIDRLVVSSEDEEILEIAKRISDELPLKRPEEIAGDEATAVEYVQHALAHFRDKYNENYDMVVIMQATSPLTLPEDIDATIRLMANSNAASAVSVVRVPVDVHPIKMKHLENGVLIPFVEEERGRMATHRYEDIYVRNGSIYVSRREVFESGKVLGEPCLAHVMPRERSVDINDEFDLVFADFLMTQKEKMTKAS